MTVHGLMSKLAEVSRGNPDLDVEIHVKTGMRKIEAELQEDVKAGESVMVEHFLNEYCEDISLSKSEVSGHEKICITADCG